jgi:hypothetical protein
MHITNRGVPWKFAKCGEPCFAGAEVSLDVSAANSQAAPAYVIMDLIRALWRVNLNP